MYLSIEDFRTIESALRTVKHDSMTDEELQKVVNADCVLMKLLKQRKASNAKTASYIAEKRKKDKNYAR